MPRRLSRIAPRAAFHALGILCVTVCATTAVCWVRGYWVVDVWEVIDGHAGVTEDNVRSLGLTSGRGVMILAYSHRQNAHPPTYLTLQQTWNASGPITVYKLMPHTESRHRRLEWGQMDPAQLHLIRRTTWQKLGFNLRSADYLAGSADRVRSWTGRAPCWAVLLVSAPGALLWLQSAWWNIDRLRHRRRWRHGLCGRCGYDIRASPTQCPECGEAVPLINV